MTAEHADVARLKELSGKVIGCAFTVPNTRGVGFLEKVYENALALELHEAGLNGVQQFGIRVLYKGVIAGEYPADLLVEDELLVERKAVKALETRTSCNVPTISRPRAIGFACCESVFTLTGS